MLMTFHYRSIKRDSAAMMSIVIVTGVNRRLSGAQSPRAGLTLIELLVVLLILSILTVVAVQATDVLVDQGRYDNTQRTLQSIDDAVVGSPNQRDADGTVLVSGFV